MLSFEAAHTDRVPRAFELRLQASAQALAQELANALEQIRTQARATQLQAITEVSARMSASGDLAELYRAITNSAAMVLESEHAILRLRDEATGRLQIRSYFGSADPDTQTALFELEASVAEEAVQAAAPVCLAHLDPERRERGVELAVDDILAHPLRRSGLVMGSLSVLGRTGGAPFSGVRFQPEDLDLLARLAEHAQRALVVMQERDRERHNRRFDELTGLPNALLMRLRLDEEISRSSGRGRTLALVRLQVRGLSELLSAQRESEADSLVLSLAQELRAGLRDFDVLARTAPDTFEILLPEPDAEVSALLGPLARRAREALRREAETPSPLDPSRLQLEFGYALFPDEGRTASALKARARESRIRSL
ncbi:MAG: GGDEF domain-containing protein [Myxococcota bacterium]